MAGPFPGHQRTVTPGDGEIEAEVWRLLDARRPGASICPSDVARSLGGDDWRALMDPVRAVAARLHADGSAVVTQGGEPVDPATARGPIRIRRPR